MEQAVLGSDSDRDSHRDSSPNTQALGLGEATLPHSHPHSTAHSHPDTSPQAVASALKSHQSKEAVRFSSRMGLFFYALDLYPPQGKAIGLPIGSG